MSEKINVSRGLLGAAKYLRAIKTVKNLIQGAPSCQKLQLPACLVKNAKTSYKNGPLVTDSIATWLKKDFARGPFDTPPFKKFRANSIMAVEQKDKTRVVLNASLPFENSFNSNIEEEKLEKVIMSSARLVGYSIVEAGKNAWISKFDLCDAYKNIPCKEEDFRIQGFEWLGNFSMKAGKFLEQNLQSQISIC